MALLNEHYFVATQDNPMSITENAVNYIVVIVTTQYSCIRYNADCSVRVIPFKTYRPYTKHIDLTQNI